MPLGTVCSGCVFESEKCHRERVDIRCCCCDCIGLSFDNRLPKEGRGFTGVKAAVIEYWNRAYRAYCLQFLLHDISVIDDVFPCLHRGCIVNLGGFRVLHFAYFKAIRHMGVHPTSSRIDFSDVQEVARYVF